MRKAIWLSLAVAGLLGFASEANAQGYPGKSDGYPGKSQGYPGKGPKCKPQEIHEKAIRNGSVLVPEFCRPKARPGYKWVDDPYGGYWEPTTTRRGYTFVRGHVESDFGAWKGEGWVKDRPGYFFVQGRYDNRGNWIAGEWKPIKKGYTWKDGFWGSDGSWNPGEYVFDPASACGPTEVYVEEIKLGKLFVPRFCRPKFRPGYKWIDDPYGGYWEPTAVRAGYTFVRGHIDGEFGSWIGEKLEKTRPGYFFVQGRYDHRGNWIAGEWKPIKKGYAWKNGFWGNDGSWNPGDYVFDPASACGPTEVYVEEIKLGKLFVPRFCRPKIRPGYKWVDDPYGGYWEPTTARRGYTFVRGYIDSEFGFWKGEGWVKDRPGYFFVQGRYDHRGNWIAGEWKPIKKGYAWKNGFWGNDGSWNPGDYVFDPASACGPTEVYVEEIKLGKLFVPRFCRPKARPGYKWVDDPYGGYWEPTTTRPGYIFVRGYIDGEFGSWKGEGWTKDRPGYAFEPGHYDAAGRWINGSWKQVTAGYKWEPGRYNTDGSWIAGSLVKDASYVVSCSGLEVLVKEVKKPRLNIPAFCRPLKKKGYKWVDSEFGGYWEPDRPVPPGKVFIRGHWEEGVGWTGEAIVPAKPGKIFVQGHYGPNGSWVEGKWIEERAGYEFKEGYYENDGSWVDGQWVEIPGYKSPKGYPGKSGY